MAPNLRLMPQDFLVGPKAEHPISAISRLLRDAPLRVPSDLPKVAIRVMEVTRVSAPKAVMSWVGDNRACLLSLIDDRINFFCNLYFLEVERIWLGASLRGLDVIASITEPSARRGAPKPDGVPFFPCS